VKLPESRNAQRDFSNEGRSIYYLDTSIWNCEKLAAEQALPEHEHHRVGRVLSFSPVVGIGLPQPLNRRRVYRYPFPFGSRGRGTLAVEESPNSDEGTYTVVLFKYVLCEELHA
jgi:hypothetical protein